MDDNKKPIFFTNLTELKDSLENGSQKDNAYAFDLNNEDNEMFTEDYEGQLSVDVYESGENIIVKSTIAGVDPKDLEIHIHDDLLTIRGKRFQDQEHISDNYFYQECYWGGFSRSIILPNEVQIDKVDATLKNGVLTVILPKSNKSKVVNIKIKN